MTLNEKVSVVKGLTGLPNLQKRKNVMIATVYDYYNPYGGGVRLYPFLPVLQKVYNVFWVQYGSRIKQIRIDKVDSNFIVIRVPGIHIKSGFFSRIKESIKSIYSIAPIIRSIQPNIIISATPSLTTLLPAVIYRKIFNSLSLACDIQDRDEYSSIYIKFQLLMMKGCDIVFSLTPFLSKYYSKLLKKKVKYIPHPVFPNLLEYMSGSTVHRATNTYRVGYAGSVNRSQGIEFLIQGFKEFLKLKKANNDQFELIIAGGCTEEESYFSYLKDLVKSKQLDSNVMFTGFIQTREKLWDWLSSFTVAVIPKPLTLFNQMCFPTKLIEYMGLGTPTIATNVGLSKQIITHGENGWLIEPDNPKKLGLLLNHIYKISNKKRKEVGEAGNHVIRQLFQFDKISKNFMNMIDEAIIINKKPSEKN